MTKCRACGKQIQQCAFCVNHDMNPNGCKTPYCEACWK